MLRGFAPEPRIGHVWASDLSRKRHFSQRTTFRKLPKTAQVLTNLERRIVAQHVPTRRWYIEDDEPPKYHCRDHGQLRPPLPRPFRRLLRSTQHQRPQQHREATYVSRYRS
jgi:hypothetical protein